MSAENTASAEIALLQRELRPRAAEDRDDRSHRSSYGSRAVPAFSGDAAADLRWRVAIDAS
jgi:hypothetical protein